MWPEVRRMSEAVFPAPAVVQDAAHVKRIRRWCRRYGFSLIAVGPRWIIY